MSCALIRSKSVMFRLTSFDLLAMSRTISPRPRSLSATSCLDGASTSPRDGTPARSIALKTKVATALGDGGHGRRSGVGAQQAPELVRSRGARLGELARDLPRSHERGQRSVHGLHPARASRL